MKSRLRRQLRNLQIPAYSIGMCAGWLKQGRNPAEAFVCLPPHLLRRGLHVIGSTGSGKTVLNQTLAGHCILQGQALFALDPRGDFVNSLLELLAQNVPPQDVAFFDLNEPEFSTPFNPCAGGSPSYVRGLSVFDAFVGLYDNWGPQTVEYTRNACTALAEGKGSLGDLDRLFTDAKFRRQLVTNISDNHLKSFWDEFDRLSPERQNLLASPVRNKFSPVIGIPPLRRILSHSQPLDFADHLSGSGRITLVSLAMHRMFSAGRIMGSLILNSATNEIFSRIDVPESERTSIRFIVDEFQHFSEQTFETLITEGRRFATSVVLSHQSLAQLTTRMRSILFGNIGAIAAFRTSREDARILSYHMSGNPKALDIAELPVGHCWLKVQGAEPLLVECNRPLVADVGRASPVAQAYRQSLRDLVPPFQQSCGGQQFPIEPLSNPRLEDWL